MFPGLGHSSSDQPPSRDRALWRSLFWFPSYLSGPMWDPKFKKWIFCGKKNLRADHQADKAFKFQEMLSLGRKKPLRAGHQADKAYIQYNTIQYSTVQYIT